MRNREEILESIAKANSKVVLLKAELDRAEFIKSVFEEELKKCKGDFNAPAIGNDILNYKRTLND